VIFCGVEQVPGKVVCLTKIGVSRLIKSGATDGRVDATENETHRTLGDSDKALSNKVQGGLFLLRRLGERQSSRPESNDLPLRILAQPT